MAYETRAAEARRKTKELRKGGVLTSLSHQQLWWLAVAYGTFFIVVAGYLDRPLFVGLVLPIFGILIYWQIGIRLQSRPGTRSQFADTIYYLGFIFTLIALAAALWYLARPGIEWTEEVRNQLIGRFGLALATTILGLGIRVAIVNLTPTEESGLAEAEESLSRAVARFRDQLEIHVGQLEMLSTTHFEKLQKATEESVDRTVKTADSLDGLITKVNNTITATVDNYSQKIAEKADNLSLPQELINDKLSKVLGTFAENLVSINESIEGSVTTQGNLARSAASLGKRFEAFDSQVGNIDRLSTSIGNVSSRIEALSVNTGALVQRLAGSISNVDQISESLLNGANSTRTAFAEFNKKLEQAIAISDVVERQHQLVNEHQEQLKSDLLASRNAVAQVHKDLTEMTNTIIERLGE